MRRAVGWALLAPATSVMSGCGIFDDSPAPAASPLCGSGPVASAGLGSPFLRGVPPENPAEFETSGGTLYVTIRNIPKTGVLDSVWAAVYIGPAASPPSYDPRRNVVTPLTVDLSVREDVWTEFTVPAGRYWLLKNNNGDIGIASCTPGGVTGRPPQPINPLSPTPSQS